MSLCSALWLAAGAAQAADVALNPQEQRITDQAVQTDLKSLQALQDRIARINAGGMAADNYYLVKAQSWLDFATHEYHENDRSQVIEQALGQSSWLVTQLEGGISGITLDTPVIPESQRLREDLWKIAAELKQHQGFSCAAAPREQGAGLASRPRAFCRRRTAGAPRTEAGRQLHLPAGSAETLRQC